MRSGYFQLEIRKEDRERTAFSTPGGRKLEFLRCGQGLNESPSTFARLMKMITGKKKLKSAWVYQNDTLIVNKTF